MTKVVFGSTNPSKFERMRSLLARVDIELFDGSLVDVGDIAEGESVRENAEVKARAFARASSRAAIATDYGLAILGLADADQPDAYVRRVKGNRAPATDEELLEHYRVRIEHLGGSAEGTWTGAIAIAFDGDDVRSTVAELTRTWIDRPSAVVRRGEPLASLQIDPATGMYVSELPVEHRAMRPNPMDEAFLGFVAHHTDELRRAAHRATDSLGT